jgi:hypothetical protein
MPKKRAALPMQQLTFADARKPDGNHGGWRPGAGRPEGRTVVGHDAVDPFASRYPILDTWRFVPDLPSLRQERYVAPIMEGIAAVHRTTFRITDFSIQTNHLHFVVEAAGCEALADGMRSLAGYIVRPLNRAMAGRCGQLVDERYHRRVLTSPREVRNALRYVINNARHHAERDHYYFHPEWIDPFSSAGWFDGWREEVSARAVEERGRRVTAEPKTWLRRSGWRKWGLLAFDEVPGRPGDVVGPSRQIAVRESRT